MCCSLLKVHQKNKVRTRANPTNKQFINEQWPWCKQRVVCMGCMGEGRKQPRAMDAHKRTFTHVHVEGKGKGLEDRPTQYFLPVHGVCSLVKQCVAFGIYRASSHLGLICLFAAGSCPGGVKPRGESFVARKESHRKLANLIPPGWLFTGYEFRPGGMVVRAEAVPILRPWTQLRRWKQEPTRNSFLITF